MPREGHIITSGKELKRLVAKGCVIKIKRSPRTSCVHSSLCRGSFAYAIEIKEVLSIRGMAQYRWYSSLEKAQKKDPVPLCTKCRRHLEKAQPK